MRLSILASALLAATMALVAAAQVQGGPTSHHFPSTLTYGSLNGIPVPGSEAEWQFEVDHLDMAHGRDHFLGIKRRKPGFFCIRYQLMETAIIGREDDKDLERFCTKAGMDPENAYLHFYDDTSWTAGGKKILVRGWQGGTATTRKEARVRSRFWELPRYVYNWADRCTREYMKARSVADLTRGEGDVPFDGVFIDEIGAPDQPDSVSLPNPAQGGRIIEYDNQTREQIVRSGAYFRDLAGLFAEVTAAMKKVSGGRSLFFLNIGNYTSGAVVEIGTAADGLLTERASGEEAMHASNGEVRLWEMARLLARRGKIFILAQDSLQPPRSPSFSAGNYRSKSDRHLMYSLVSYWMARQGNSTYFEQAHDWLPLSRQWIRAQEANLGRPLGDYSVWKESTAAGDSAGQRYRVYRRDYQNAILLFRTRYDWDPKSFRDYGGKTPEFELGGSYRVLFPDGKFGPPLDRIGLHLAEGVVLAPAPAVK